VVVTSMGAFTVELFLDDSPITTANFLAYVDEGFFDGTDGEGATIFHRVIADFVIQGGGQTAEGTQKSTHAAIVNEAIDSGLSNVRGTLAMARTNAPDSATSQWFVNVVDNTFLDPGDSTPDGYAVFAEVVEGMDVVDAIAGVATNGADQPLTPVVMESVTRE
jgi:cyclophilin family peptidyl-prolyl cis-trans isomerase